MIDTRTAIPECLRTLPQWVGWKYIVRSGKQTKAPVDPASGSLADATDPSTWSSFDTAFGACEKDSSLEGVGFVFTADDSLCGIDIDNCRDAESGDLKPWAAELIARLNSYSEVSPSGTGVKAFVRASKPGRRCRTRYHDGEIEVYDAARFFTVTGERLPNVASDVESRQEIVDTIYHELFGGDDSDGVAVTPPVPKPSDNGSVQLSDHEIIDLASKQRRTGEKFRTLWSGEWNKHFNSASEADSSVAFTLAFYTKDANQIDRLFRTSGLMRPKWDELHGEQTYGEMTIDKALSTVTKQYKPRRKKRRIVHADQSQAISGEQIDSEKPSITVTGRQLSDLTEEATSALLQSNDPPSVFVRAGQLARVVNDEQNVPRIDAFDAIRLRCRLAEVADFFALRERNDVVFEVATSPPKLLAENLLAQSSWDFPPLAGITRSPILRPDGSICTTPGYDKTTRLFYSPDPGLKLVPVPDEPCGEEVQACVDILLDTIADFPFVDDASRANAMAILFSLLMRPVIQGHVPLAIVDAPMQGTGKTLLATALASIATGCPSSESIPAKDNDDEWRKKITSLLLSASPFVLLDNIPDNTTLNAPPLAAALTSSEWSDRLLGRNDAVRLPSRAVWVATGNNLRVAGDMPRRSYGIRLDANAERPWERTGFRIKSLQQHVQKKRGELLSAALTIIRGWYAHGKPKADVPSLGSFEEWAETVGSVLAYAGIHGFLTNLEQTQTVQDEDTQQWTAFFDAWWERFGSKSLTANDLCRAVFSHGGDVLDLVDEGLVSALPEPLIVNRDKGQGAFKRSLGRHLSRLKGRVFNGRKVSDAGVDSKRHIRLWQLVESTNPPSNQPNGEAGNV